MSSSVEVTAVPSGFDLTRSERPVPPRPSDLGIEAPTRRRPAAPVLIAWSLASHVVESSHRKFRSAIGRLAS